MLLFASLKKKNNYVTNCRSWFWVIKITLRIILIDDKLDERGIKLCYIKLTVIFLLESIKLSNTFDTQF